MPESSHKDVELRDAERAEVISNNESTKSIVHEKHERHEQEMLLFVFFVPFLDSLFA